jgi:hypothetical protein
MGQTGGPRSIYLASASGEVLKFPEYSPSVTAD